MRPIVTGALALLLLPTSAPASAATPAAAPAPLRIDANRSTLAFQFTQAGAATDGRFRRLSGSLQPAAANPGTLDVSIDVASVDTGDAERDGLLRGPDLFDAKKQPLARFRVARLPAANAAGQVLLDGTLTLRGVSRALRIPAQLSITGSGAARSATLSGSTTLRRLDYGIGQGEWASTQWIANEVKVSFRLVLKAGP